MVWPGRAWSSCVSLGLAALASAGCSLFVGSDDTPDDAPGSSCSSAALELDSAEEDHIVLADDPALDQAAFTAQIWVRLDDTVGPRSVISMLDQNQGRGWEVAAVDGQPRVFVATSNRLCVGLGLTEMMAGTWYHLAVSHRFGFIYLFVDGKQEAMVDCPGDYRPDTLDLMIGRNAEFAIQHIDGAVDDFVYLPEIVAIDFDPFVLPGCSPGVAVYRFDEGDGQDVVDSCGAAVTGTLGNLPEDPDNADPSWVTGDECEP